VSSHLVLNSKFSVEDIKNSSRYEDKAVISNLNALKSMLQSLSPNVYKSKLSCTFGWKHVISAVGDGGRPYPSKPAYRSENNDCDPHSNGPGNANNEGKISPVLGNNDGKKVSSPFQPGRDEAINVIGGDVCGSVSDIAAIGGIS
jgi:hypothetical protein